MKIRSSLNLSLTLLFISLSTTSSYAAFDPAAIFDKKCASCHTVGGGDDVGPDLKGITERRPEDWLIQMIQDSQGLIQSGDPVAVQLFEKFRKKKMPSMDLSPDEVRQLLAFIKGGGPGEAPLDAKPATAATEAEIQLGRELFLGLKTFSGGGPACISCHQAGSQGILGGGTLGLDLTQVYSRYEDKGLSKALAKMAFPVMSEVYAGRPLTPEEAFALKAFFLKEDQKGESGAGFQKKFVFLGLSGAVLLLGGMDLFWRKRRQKSAKPVHGGLS